MITFLHGLGRTQPFSRIDHASSSAPQMGGALNENPATAS